MLQLWVEYAENKPGAYGYSRYCELYGQWKKKLNPTMRQRHRAGEKTFVDFSGKKPHIVDPKTGELVEMELFVGTLGASSYTYVELDNTATGEGRVVPPRFTYSQTISPSGIAITRCFSGVVDGHTRDRKVILDPSCRESSAAFGIRSETAS